MPRNLFPILRSAGLAIVVAATRLAAAPGDEHWDVQFDWPGTTNSVYALAVQGNQVYAGGTFFTPAQATNNFVEVWDGNRWSYIPGLQGSPGQMRVNDFAFVGGELYVAGQFSRAGPNPAGGLARWNGTAWSDVAGFQGQVLTTVADGSKLYVGGIFTSAGGVQVTNVAGWNGSQWFGLGGGLGSRTGPLFKVDVLHLHQGALYAGGTFTNSGRARVRNLARFDGINWVEVGGGADASVLALASEGSNLYAGGAFINVGSTTANRIARWDGTNWFALGSGVNNNQVSAIGILGGRVYIGGTFTGAEGVPEMRCWNGSAWAATGTGFPDGEVLRMKVAGTNLYVGGTFTLADDRFVNHVGVWNGTEWNALSQAGRGNGLGGMYIGVDAAVRAIAQAGNDIYVAGTFSSAGKIGAHRIARFDGTAWHPLGSGIQGAGFVPGFVLAIAVSGTNLYAGGIFTNAGGVTVSNIARWDGNAWFPLGNGIAAATVSAIAVRGSDVFVGGSFFMNTPSGAAFSIARWNGSTWSPLRSGGGLGGTAILVNAIAVRGSNIVVGGRFFAANASAVQSTNLAMHDGNDWISMGGGVNGDVNAIAVLGTDVFVGGNFSSAGGVAASRIARWNGSSWSSLGSGIVGNGDFFVTGLAAIGTNLYVSGDFTNAGGVTVNMVAKWNGSVWSGLGNGLTPFLFNTTFALCARGNDLFVGGTMEYAGGKPSFLLARWNDHIDFDTVPKLRLDQFLGSSTGPFKMTVTANGPAHYVIEGTTNFSSWTPLLTNTASPFEFQDFTAPSRPHRFYRARQGP